MEEDLGSNVGLGKQYSLHCIQEVGSEAEGIRFADPIRVPGPVDKNYMGQGDLEGDAGRLCFKSGLSKPEERRKINIYIERERGERK